MNTILAKKIGTTQVFVGDKRVAATKLDVSPMTVVQIKNESKDGYNAIQFGIGKRRSKNTSKSLQGHLHKAQNKDTKIFLRKLREVRTDETQDLKVGDKVEAGMFFKQGDVISVKGMSKGKGFAGGVKKWGFHGGPKTHGQSDRLRAPGSIGAGTTPGRVYKGKKMAGRMGFNMVTVKNLHVISIYPDNCEMVISGQVPGNPGNFVLVNKISEGSLKDLEKETVAAVVEEEVKEEVKKDEN